MLLPRNPRPLDTHCHIDLYAKPADVVREWAAWGGRGIAVTNAPFVFPHTHKLVAGYAGIEAALGMHPELVSARAKEIDLFRQYLPQTRFVGEVGLDFVTVDRKNRELQQQVFGDIVTMCSAAGDKILTVHSRRAAAEVIEVIGPTFRGRAILHWFSGSIKELEKAQRYGMYFSVNPAMVLNQSGQSLIRRMDPTRVLTETDGPFVKIRDAVALPWNVTDSLTFLGKVWGCTTAAAGERINGNYDEIIRLPF